MTERRTGAERGGWGQATRQGGAAGILPCCAAPLRRLELQLGTGGQTEGRKAPLQRPVTKSSAPAIYAAAQQAQQTQRPQRAHLMVTRSMLS